jgi:hypothetical protein
MPKIDQILSVKPGLIVVKHGKNLELFDIILNQKDLKCELRNKLLEDTDFKIVKVDEHSVFVSIEGKITQILIAP